jgi:hypothetical protein
MGKREVVGGVSLMWYKLCKGDREHCVGWSDMMVV